MPGKASFIFDDGHRSHYETAWPVFQDYHVPAALAIISSKASSRPGIEVLRELEESGWEILSHSMSHAHFDDMLSPEDAIREIADSKAELTSFGLHIRGFVTPYSSCAFQWNALLRKHYDYAFTVYTNSHSLSIEELVQKRPLLRYELHRCSLSDKTDEELLAYIDYLAETDSRIFFYDHDVGAGKNISGERLRILIEYAISKGVEIRTPSEILDSEPCLVHRIRRGYNGSTCLVHARCAPGPDHIVLATAQDLSVDGCDTFNPIQYAFSSDDGRTFEPLSPLPGNSGMIRCGNLTLVGCDFTPIYHPQTGTFLVIGHNAAYEEGAKRPAGGHKHLCYFVCDPKTRCVSEMKTVEFSESGSFHNIGSGCTQTVIASDGTLWIPLCHNAEKSLLYVCAAHFEFDGTTLQMIEKGPSFTAETEARGLGEPSLICHHGRFYMTIRSDGHGYHAESADGLHFSEPEFWRFDDGEILPNYNTQQHWCTISGRLWLVYTRKAGTNDHVFRHRAPLFAAPVDPETVRLIRAEERVVVPEAGARLGNFAAGTFDEKTAFVMAAEWMQPIGCEQYGSDNSVYLSFLR